ncbi:DUF397 domain-containing protein [Streptomyces sp. NPDC088747]|uniref:DUF397 domain-containing protein n=1 Tax=Streptomyces sp. NPDC088747 TaxID=3365886 RepID=UPI00382F076D
MVNTGLAWFKSSYSGTEGGNCVEVAHAWFKSTYSGTEGGDCVEVALTPRTVHVRDSKLNPSGSGPELTVPASVWAEFITHVGA